MLILLVFNMAKFECPDSGIQFVISTEDGFVHGTNIPYIESCPFCGTDMKHTDCIEKGGTHF